MDRRQSATLSAGQLARMLGGWAENPGKLPARLARALRQLVELGELVPGTRLPSERALASALVISRATATRTSPKASVCIFGLITVTEVRRTAVSPLRRVRPLGL